MEPADRFGEISVCYSVRFERRSKHPASRLWRAITDPEELAQWWGMPRARVDLRPGGEYFVEFPPANPNDLEGVLTHVEPERRLRYVWGLSVIEWEIDWEPDPGEPGSGCAYRFTHHGQPPGLIEHEGGIAAGYHAGFYRLDAYLDGATFRGATRLWEELLPVYAERIREALAQGATEIQSH